MPEAFFLDGEGEPTAVAGVPDYFSATGQRWGNPLYRWRRMKKTGYAWWIDRLRVALRRFDVVRLDHFIGFQRYWRIPATCPTAVVGRWVKGPGADFFLAAEKALGALPLIAEDLGVVSPAVFALRDRFRFPGIKILQFAFGADPSAPTFLPHNYSRRSVVYTGTHDNDTTAGWFGESGGEESTRSAAQAAIGARGDAPLPRLGRPGDPLGHDPRRARIRGAPGHRPLAGRARPGLGGAHEPPGHVARQLGVALHGSRAHRRARRAARAPHADVRARARRARRARRDSMSRHAKPTPIGLLDEPTWYKDAIIYELRTRSFFDSNDDGIGDFRGLASKLDYLLDLGVTALWLLPFYPSPGRDDGYDIADYTEIHPDLGTLADFEHLLASAHRRGIRIITELVLNHTSDQHPWFQRARRAPRGSPERDFYVWREEPDRYREARIIFKDFEPSNWSWDSVAGAHFWHRFYAHQPDLNFENPAVQEALLAAVDFWFEKGVDGLRLDAVPYLYEEDGTSCENLPATHAFLKKLRAHIDSKFKNRLLLAEANQWPEDAAAYFGNGDECHMNFHFPLMPRMFLSIHTEDRFPIIDIFAQTPHIPDTCQWALFLRNHDELTLEMVTDEERDYMYRAYADEAAMRINLGIRRRLAPLVGNNRRKMELLNGLLFSLPGTPVLYYGDEIGMGDNVYLGDRNGVRTPMQWNMDRNAGFSRANPQKLILPVVIDPEYRYESVNVENQQQNPSSLLWWTKRLIALRKRFAAFGRGSMRFLESKNPRVLAFVREHGDERVLVVANLSRFVQYVEIDLKEHKGMLLVELFGKTKFPEIGDAPYLLTLGPHGFYWFALERAGALADRPSMFPEPLPTECTSLEALLLGHERRHLDGALPTFLEGRPWFQGRDRALRGAHVVEGVALPADPSPIFFTPRSRRLRERGAGRPSRSVRVGPGRARGGGGGAPGPRAIGGRGRGRRRALRRARPALGGARSARGHRAGGLRGRGATYALGVAVRGLHAGLANGAPEPRRMGLGRTDTTLAFGESFVLKLLRGVDEGGEPRARSRALPHAPGGRPRAARARGPRAPSRSRRARHRGRARELRPARRNRVAPRARRARALFRSRPRAQQERAAPPFGARVPRDARGARAAAGRRADDRGLPRHGGPARRAHRAAPSRAGVERDRPGVRPGAVLVARSSLEVPVAPEPLREGAPPPARASPLAPGAGAKRGRGDPRERGGHLAVVHRPPPRQDERAPDPGARQPAPRARPLHGQGLRLHRLQRLS